MNKKFELRGILCPYSDLETRQTYFKRPSSWLLPMEIGNVSKGPVAAWAIICWGWPESFHLTDWGRSICNFHAVSHWGVKQVEKFEIDKDNDEYLLSLPPTEREAILKA